MTHPTRIYKHSSAGTDWAALLLGAGLGLTLALQFTTVRRTEVVKIYEITDGAIATSGTYERGAHIHDPLDGLIAIGAKSATVTGPLGWLCDALATAVMVGGEESAKWFGQPELEGYRVFAVNRHEESSWEI